MVCKSASDILMGGVYYVGCVGTYISEWLLEPCRLHKVAQKCFFRKMEDTII